MSVTDKSQEVLAAYDRVLAVALLEDLGDAIDLDADVTTTTTVPEDLWGKAQLVAKQDGVICGLDALSAAFAQLDDRVSVVLNKRDGDDVTAGEVLAAVDGPVRPILVGERSALNVIGHLSGIATLVRAFARTAPAASLVDTRKTLPGLRLLQKYAVRVGGGSNHRFSLWDGVLVKDTHIVAAGGVGEAVRRARAGTSLPVQAECTSIGEIDEALDAGAHALLLDNQGADALAKQVAHIRARPDKDHVMIEASGGITLDNLAEVVASGVDRVSIGAFTHSAPALDVSMRLIETRNGARHLRSVGTDH